MSDNPDISPVLDQMFGPQYRVELREALLARAAAADDPAYADRLREAADGRRPLRALLSDPSFQASLKVDQADRGEVESRTPTLEEQEELRRRLAAFQQEHGMPAFPSTSALASLASDAAARAQRTRDFVAADELSGWHGSVERLAGRHHSVRPGPAHTDGREPHRG